MLSKYESGAMLRFYGVATQEALEKKLQKNLSETENVRVAIIGYFNSCADSGASLVELVSTLIHDSDHLAVIEALIMAGWSVKGALSIFEGTEHYEYLCALYSEDEGEEV